MMMIGEAAGWEAPLRKRRFLLISRLDLGRHKCYYSAEHTARYQEVKLKDGQNVYQEQQSLPSIWNRILRKPQEPRHSSFSTCR